ncbi:hypothetical protein [Dactylosporangium sp. NPDC049140]|jgi:hypothetical protein|uniref:hypothetical protein n=1 Tax=Dactylosporangium sp. NPDC049140 TaxID=3155647 RepID=UPI0033E60539
MRFVTLIVGAGLAVAGLAGCASTAEPVTAPPPSIVPPAPSAVVPSAHPSLTLGSSQPLISVRGTVKDGIEPGCMLLTTDKQTYLLVGGDRAALKSGATLTVYGTPEPELMSTCQQGTPFRVSRVEN